jgi:drug/metabolite transporter (DMT)-like permease
MTELERKSWETIRSRGRDRFLLQGIIATRWILVGGPVIALCWWLFTGKLLEPLWSMAIGWLLFMVFVGTFGALIEWNTNERKFEESKNEQTGR